MGWWSQPTPTDLGRAESGPAMAQEIHVTTSERMYTMVPLTRLQVDNQPIGQDASLIEAATQSASTTMSGVKLTSPIAPPNQAEKEKQYVLVMTASIRQLNLEMTGVILRDTVTTSPRRSAFQNPHMAAVLSRPVPARRAISNQGATVKELERNDAE